MISQNKYIIGMFAVKPISYGEELTFDYNSITEKENEYKEAICLCGTYYCRGHYLIYSNGNSYNEVISQSHSFLHRNAILLKASTGFSISNNVVSDKDKKELELGTKEREFLSSQSIGKCLLEDGTPEWMLKWAYYIVKFCLFERKLMPGYRLLVDKGKEKVCWKEKGELPESMRLVKKILDLRERKERIDQGIEEKPSGEEREEAAQEEAFNLIINKADLISEGSSYHISKNDLELREEASTEIQNTHTKETTEENGILNDHSDIPQIYYNSGRPTRACSKNNQAGQYKEEKGKEKETLSHMKRNLIDINSTTNNNCILKKPTTTDSTPLNAESYIRNSVNNKAKSKQQGQIKAVEDLLLDIPKSYDFLSEGLKDSRVQNMSITINKVLHVLELMDTKEPPIVSCTNQEVIEFLYGKKETSIRSSILFCISNLIDKGSKSLNSIFIEIIEILNQEDTSLFNHLHHLSNGNSNSIGTDSTEPNNSVLQEKLLIYKSNLKRVARLLYQGSKDSSSKRLSALEPLAVMLYMQASVESFFKPNSKYQTPRDSVKISILQRDICMTNQVNKKTNFSEDDLNRVITEGTKKYDKMYVWGQLIGWFKQTVNKPDASISAERRGSLVYPDVECFFLSNIVRGSIEKETEEVSDCEMDGNEHKTADNQSKVNGKGEGAKEVNVDTSVVLESNGCNGNHIEKEEKEEKEESSEVISELVSHQSLTETYDYNNTNASNKSKNSKLSNSLFSQLNMNYFPSIDHYSTRKHPPNKYIKTGYIKADSVFNYPLGNDLPSFLQKLSDNPSAAWPVGNRWSFKNKERIYGTVQFDCALKEIEAYEATPLSSPESTYHSYNELSLETNFSSKTMRQFCKEMMEYFESQ
eukprot:CAMPEP_0170539032 /NCGR_PEP_ID=MMETSP0209-20121228/103672_1 /TAXON_ID=665100 ORGANISM="Litonotus pictus, Strain P1" /NCGR_SAMPLE_ID=MMETSP0209 /ASSEMBLY_ACC=CAM_ASM_000301 /LENGTH=871 /DNA_ID=CAMNT_0010840851 /DNA_START=1778 /DNA_END=4393 /DNA_ORIENTATION=-